MSLVVDKGDKLKKKHEIKWELVRSLNIQVN